MRILITFTGWMSRTKVKSNLRGRSKLLKDVDRRLEAYLEHRTPKNFDNLVLTFDAWKQSKGAKWKDSSRNKNGAITELDGFLQQEHLEIGLRPSPEADHQRLGVLYLLGKLEIANAPQAIAKQIFAATLGVAGSTGITQHAHAHLKTLGGGVPGGIPDADVNAVTGDQQFKGNWQDSRQYSQQRGAMFDPKQSSSPSNPVHTYIDSVRDSAATAGVGAMGGHRSGAAGIGAPPEITGWLHKIKKKLWEVANWCLSLLSSAAKMAARQAVEEGISRLVQLIFDLSVSLGGAVVKTLEGAYKTIKAVRTKWQAANLLAKARINAGHAATMIRAITKEMASDIWDGLKTVFGGVLDGVVTLMSAGAGIIVTVIKAGICAIIDVVKMFMTVSSAKAVLTEAKAHWLQGKAAGTSAAGSGPIHSDALRFNRWFSTVCDRSVPMAVLCLKSGVCSNLFAMLDTGDPTRTGAQRQVDFDNTQKALQFMKDKGGRYLNDSPLRFVSSDQLVSQTVIRVTKGGMLGRI